METLLTSLELLCNQCDLPSVKRKQKMLAKIVLSYIANQDKTKTKEEILNCLKEVCNLHNKFPEEPGNVIVGMIRLENFPNLKESILQYSESVLNTDRITSFLNILSTKIKSLEIINKTDEIIKNLVDIKSLNSDFQIVDSYKKLIHSEYINILKSEDNEHHSELEITKSMNLDTLREIIEEISLISKSRNRLTSGLKTMDTYLQDGFESTRIYIFGGKPGLGKSTLILNFFINAAKKPPKTKTNKPEALIYITLENDIVETFERIIRISTGTNKYVKDLTDQDIEDLTFYLQNSFEKNIIVKYMIPYRTNTMDIFMYVDKLSEQYTISGIFIDYLNLVSSAEKNKHVEKRFELGMVTAELKVLGKRFQCPVVVPTQLNTAGYEGIPTMKNLDESRQIAQNADFVGLMFECPSEKVPVQLLYKYPEEKYKFIGINIDKNRNAQTGVTFLVLEKNLYSFYSISKSIGDVILSRLRNRESNENNGYGYNNGYNKNQSENYYTGVAKQYNDKTLNTI